ncbi:MAG: AAA family ATPase [Actinomycetota bacterium]
MNRCSTCGSENPAAAKFCMECGATLSVRAFAQDRKVITALICDVVGSTELGERMDPEDVDRLQRTYHAIARRRIENHGGVVEKFIGDAVVGVFGVPAAHEDDAERAVRAALRIIQELDASDLGIQVRIGVHTGEALVTVGVDPSSGQGFVTGDSMNTTARLEAAAPPMGVVVGELTYRSTEHLFAYEPLGSIHAKGKAEPVPAWRASRPLTRTGGEGADSTPFVGRDLELGMLSQLFARSVQDAATEFVTVVGEPGMGKSRLVRELATYVDAWPELVTWRLGRCLPYGDGISFWALGEIVKAHAGILDSDDQATLSAKLDAALVEPDPSLRTWMKDRLGPLVGLEASTLPPQQDEAFTAWRRFLEQIAQRGPTVLVFEDLHWAESAFIAFLTHLTEQTHGLPLLVITTARPEVEERHAAWLGRSRRSTILSLTPLADRDMTKLITATMHDAPPEMVSTILERAGGSPLYAEQLAAMVRDRAMPIAGGALDLGDIPPTVQALCAARIDALPVDLKAVLQDAAVMGKAVWSGAVAALADRNPAEIDELLTELSRREFLRPVHPSSLEGEREFAFWHALVRDVAYAQLPRPVRMAKHHAAADWIVAQAGGALSEEAEIVADHFAQALGLAKELARVDLVPELGDGLVSSLLRAADHAMRTDVPRAAAHLYRVLDLLPRGDARLFEARVGLGRALIATSDYPQAAVVLQEVVESRLEYGDEVGAANLTVPLVIALANSGEAAKGGVALEHARQLLGSEPGPVLLDVLSEQAMMALLTARDARALSLAEDALALARELGLAEPHRALAARGMTLLAMGRTSGEQDMRDAIEGAITEGDLRAAAVAYHNLAASIAEARGPAAGLEAFDEAVGFAAGRGLPTELLRSGRLETLVPLGRWDEALAESEVLGGWATDHGDEWGRLLADELAMQIRLGRGEKAERQDDLPVRATQVGTSPSDPAPIAADAASMQGDLEAARGLLRDVLAQTPSGEIYDIARYVRSCLAAGAPELAHQAFALGTPPSAWNEAKVLAAQAMLQESDQDCAAARERFEAAAQVFQRLGDSHEEAHALQGMGRCLLALDRSDEARAPLLASRSVFEAVGAAGRVAEIDQMLTA